FLRGARGAARVSQTDIITLFEHAVHRACARIHEQAVADPEKRGMGTTLSALLVLGVTGFIAHVGDSRIYMTRGNVTSQVTEDHTVYNELIKKGKLTPEQIAKVSAKKNAITRAVGVYERVEVDTLSLELLPGDQFVLASDGLTQYLREEGELGEHVSVDAGDEAVRGLIHLANDRGGSDNITVILVRMLGDAAEAEERKRRLALKREVLVKMPIFARLAERELLRVLQVAEVLQFAPGARVISEGDKGDELFIMLSGKAGVSKGGSQLTTLGMGEHFGEMALIRAAARSATVIAETQAEILCIRRAQFFEILRREHEIGVKILWQFLGVLADRLDQTSSDLRSAREELAAEEIDLTPDDHDPFG
ncbi:cyclic nucleotide-binding domain-containing protein, partial [bacterium]